MTLVLKKAPSFKATAVVAGEVIQDFSLEQYEGKYVVLFFYPKDFSGICPSEMWAFQESLSDFESRNAVVVACSTDSEEVHKAWLNTPREKGGIEGATYPIISDTSKTIATNYGVLAGEYFYDDEGKLAFEGAPIALRATFIIDKSGVVMHEAVNFFTVARAMDNILRELDAIQNFQEHGQICLANWKKA